MTGHRRSQRVMRPSTRVEREHWQAGRTVIVGADAVGVASLSGPVVAAAVAWPPYARRVPGVRDSKMLSRAQRERLFPYIRRRAMAVGIGAASVAEIDRINIYHATNLAMRRAICRVAEREHVLIDGLRVYRLPGARRRLHGDRSRRREVLLDCRRVDHRQGHSRPAHGPAGVAVPVLRLGAQRRLRDARPSAGDRGARDHAFHRRSFARIRAVELGEQMELDFTAIRCPRRARRARGRRARGRPGIRLRRAITGRKRPVSECAHHRPMGDPRHDLGLAGGGGGRATG